MTTLTLHSFRRCPFAIRARMTLEEKGLAYRTIEEDLSSLSAELLALHPEGRVPLLIHQIGEQRHVIYESSIITQYLDEAFPEPKLMPPDATQRAQLRLWTYWCDQIFKPDLDQFKYELKTLSETEGLALQARLRLHFSRWNSALEKNEFLLGPELTLADIHLFPFARQFLAIRPPLAGIEKYQLVTKWLARIVERPSFDRVMRVG